MFARTKRLTLRPGWPEDAAAIAQAIGHKEVVTKLSRVPWPYTEANAAEWLATPRAKDNVSLSILAHEEAIPLLVGGIGVHPAEDLDGYELGYWLAPGAWGRGYATEAGRAVLDIARYAMGLKSLRSRYYVDNPASGNVLRKLGFRPTGRMNTYSLARGREAESITLALDFDADAPLCRMSIAA